MDSGRGRSLISAIAIEQADLVSEYPLRSLAAQCLASLADYGADDLDEQPPLRRDFDDTTAGWNYDGPIDAPAAGTVGD